MKPNEASVDLPLMEQKKPVDLANEPVDLDEDEIVDTGVLHEDKKQDQKQEGA